MTRLEMAQALRAHDNYIILTHRRPDGDTLGSAAGLCLGLRALGKNAWVLKNRQLTPKLAPFTEGLVTDTCPEHATVLSVDIASLGLLSFDAEELSLGDQIALAIDHHGSNDLNAPKLVEADRAACGEIILELLELLGVTLTEKLANALYLAISTDTGCFKFSNTTAHTHAVAAACLTAGIDGGEINRALFETKSRPRFEMERIVFDTMEFHENGAIAVAVLWRRDIDHAGADMDDLDSIASLTRQIEGVQIGITLTEKPDGTVRVSVRTTKEMDASAICKRVGGGGHVRAAGASFTCGMDEAKAEMLRVAKEQFHAAD